MLSKTLEALDKALNRGRSPADVAVLFRRYIESHYDRDCDEFDDHHCKMQHVVERCRTIAKKDDTFISEFLRNSPVFSTGTVELFKAVYGQEGWVELVKFTKS